MHRAGAWAARLVDVAVPEKVTRISAFRPNDGRYFFFDARTALSFRQSNDEYR